MSTRSFIITKTEDGKYKGVYCHFDGYPKGVGKKLDRYYTNQEIVDKLISFGALSVLDKNIEPTSNQRHNFEHKAENVSVFYHRDRGDAWDECKPLIFNDVDEIFNRCTGVDYIYIFSNNCWHVAAHWDVKGKFFTVDEYIEKEKMEAEME